MPSERRHVQSSDLRLQYGFCGCLKVALQRRTWDAGLEGIKMYQPSDGQSFSASELCDRADKFSWCSIGLDHASDLVGGMRAHQRKGECLEGTCVWLSDRHLFGAIKRYTRQLCIILVHIDGESSTLYICERW